MSQHAKLPVCPEQFESQWLDAVSSLIESNPQLVFLSKIEGCFLNGLIRATKPKALLEVGVHYGGSSVLMLNAIKDDSDAHLCAVDIRNTICEGPHMGKRIGWAVEEYVPELTDRYSLFTGGHLAKFIDKIGKNEKIDFCFLDSAHTLPGEILDFLIVLPFMQKLGIVVLHDTSRDHELYAMNKPLNRMQYVDNIANSVLFAVARAEKFKPMTFDRKKMPTANMGALIVGDDTWAYIDDLFWALNLKWRYLPSNNDMEYIIPILEEHYARKNVDMFLDNYEVNKLCGTSCKHTEIQKFKDDTANKSAWLHARLDDLHKQSNTVKLTALCFGTGSMAENILPAIRADALEIKVFIDERPSMRGALYAGIPVIDFSQISGCSFDYILVACRPADRISQRLRDLGIPAEKIVVLDVETLFWEQGTADKKAMYSALLAYLQSFPGLVQAIDVPIFLDSPWLKNAFAKKK